MRTLKRINPSELKEIDGVINTAKLMLKTNEIVLTKKKETPLYILAELLYISGTVDDLIANINDIQQTQLYSKPKKTMSFYVSPMYIANLFNMFDEVYSDQFKQKLQLRMKEAFALHSKLVLKIEKAMHDAIKEPSKDDLILKVEELIATSHSLVRIIQNISSNLEDVSE